MMEAEWVGNDDTIYDFIIARRERKKEEEEDLMANAMV